MCTAAVTSQVTSLEPLHSQCIRTCTHLARKSYQYECLWCIRRFTMYQVQVSYRLCARVRCHIVRAVCHAQRAQRYIARETLLQQHILISTAVRRVVYDTILVLAGIASSFTGKMESFQFVWMKGSKHLPPPAVSATIPPLTLRSFPSLPYTIPV